MDERALREQIFELREEVRQLRAQLVAPNGPDGFLGLELTRTERSVLASLLTGVRTRDGLWSRVNADRGAFGEQEPKTLDVVMCKLRAKLATVGGGGQVWIRTIYGIGYQLTDEGRAALDRRKG